MSYCRFGPDSDVYVFPSTWYIDGAPCWVLMTNEDQLPRTQTFFIQQMLYDRLIELHEMGYRVPDEALARIRHEMEGVSQ